MRNMTENGSEEAIINSEASKLTNIAAKHAEYKVATFCVTDCWSALKPEIARIRTSAAEEAARKERERIEGIVWPMLKQEYEWRHEDSECGGDEIEEGLDMLHARLRAALLTPESASDGYDRGSTTDPTDGEVTLHPKSENASEKHCCGKCASPRDVSAEDDDFGTVNLDNEEPDDIRGIVFTGVRDVLAEVETIRSVLAVLPDWWIRQYAGANPECLFCGRSESKGHDQECLGERARLALTALDRLAGKVGQ